jgi:hypothetical protein
VTDTGDSDTDTGASRAYRNWTFIWAFEDADTDQSVWVWRHAEGAGVVVRVPGAWTPSEHPGAYLPPLEMMDQLLGRNG